MKMAAKNAFGESVHETVESQLVLNISNKDEEGKDVFLTSAHVFLHVTLSPVNLPTALHGKYL